MPVTPQARPPFFRSFGEREGGARRERARILGDGAAGEVADKRKGTFGRERGEELRERFAER